MDEIQAWREQGKALCEWLKAEDARIEKAGLFFDVLAANKLQVIVGNWDATNRRATGEMVLSDEVLADRAEWPAILDTIRHAFDGLYGNRGIIRLHLCQLPYHRQDDKGGVER